MIAVVQRVLQASVRVDGVVCGQIGAGLLVLLGVAHADEEADVAWLSRKLVQLRIFADASGQMNRSVQAVGGEILLVSQFTLHASVKKGNRPSFVAAAPPRVAIPLYESMVTQLAAALGRPVQTGRFGADMQVALVNDGPVTLIIDTSERRQTTVPAVQG